MRFLKAGKAALLKKLQRAYRYSELRKLQQWLQGKTLHWAMYLALALLLLSAVLGTDHYRSSIFYVVGLEGRELGTVRDGASVEHFIDDLTAKCCSFYGMTVEPEQAVTLNREYRSRGEDDVAAVSEALRQQLRFTAEAVMLTIDQVPVIPLASKEKVDEAIALLGDFYISRCNKLLRVSLLEEITATPCTVPPEAVCTPEAAAALLRDGPEAGEERMLLASREGERRSDLPAAPPLVHVQTVEEVTITEKIPCGVSYRYTEALWCYQSRVLEPGKAGKKEVAYEVTRENGREIGRRRVGERVLEKPVTRIIEQGTASAPALGSGRFLWPVRGGRISSGYRSAARPNHVGIDIDHPAGMGTPILAADDGVVVEAGSRYPRGNYIVIYHGSYYTLYAHNQVNRVSAGDTVKRGELVALMGNTGRTRGLTGVHLHFEVRLANQGSWSSCPTANPLSFF